VGTGARVRAAAVAFVLTVTGALAAAQDRPALQLPPTQALDVQRVDETAAFVYFNRPILVFRARLLGRSPADRVAAAHRLLDDLVEERATAPVDVRPYGSAMLISVASRGALVVTEADVDELSGETLAGTAAHAAGHLQLALTEATEARAPGRLLRSAGLAALAIVLAVILIRTLASVRRRLTITLINVAERRLAPGVAREALHASRTLGLQRYIVGGAVGVIELVVLYGVTTYVLRLFPYTRPWGESMRGYLLTTAESLTIGALRAVPGLFVVAIVLVIARLVVRGITAWLVAVEQGRVESAWVHPETAQPTRRIATVLLWAFATIVAYPYLPGSGSDAFKGVSVFLGLMLTFGSSGLVNQYMSGFVIMYSRSLRVGDFVRIGDVEGTVEKLGVLSTKIKTPWAEDVTIPNAVVVGQTTIDYSRTGDTVGLYTPTTVTIGYDAPWRQVHALLLQAAERTPGLRTDPKPMVIQTGLDDFYVRYTLLVSLERQSARPFTLAGLNANIQDAFNEAGVQIMSPNYVFDPKAPKIVPKEHWDPAPTVKA
jgi:small-conductance mechanosensitive channel